MNKPVSREILPIPTKFSLSNIPPPIPASPDSSNASVRVHVSRHSGSRVPTPTGVPNCPCYACRKFNLSLANPSRSLSHLDEPNYVRKNIKDTKKYIKPAPPVVSRVVDHPKGDRVPPMVFFMGGKGNNCEKVVLQAFQNHG